jgi:heavy metal sensor kinase
MRSIRLSLTVYFLLLLTVALGAVLAFLYQTTAHTLEEKDRNAVRFLDAENENRCKALEEKFKSEILQRAQDLARHAQTQWGQSSHLAVFLLTLQGAGVRPDGPLTAALWAREGPNGPLTSQMGRQSFLKIQFPDETAPARPGGREVDYFQFSSEEGRAVQRSRSLGDQTLALDPDLRGRVALYQHEFDEVALSDGVRVVRVTLKMPVASVRRASNRLMMDGRDAPRGTPWKPGPTVPPERPYWAVPAFFIQYARDTSERDRALAAFQRDFQFNKAQQRQESEATLASLQRWVLGTALAAFAASIAGACWLIGVGLSPLKRLSDAVSRVSPKDFRLPCDPATLPQELQPIYDRLTQTLALLERAFAREKQATADISHELRTPLTALLTTLDVGLRRPRTPAQYTELLVNCRAVGLQLTQLVERILALARIDAGADSVRRQEVDVAALAGQCVALVRPLAEARDLTLELHADGPEPLTTDPSKLREVITNLLHNAVEYNRPRGRIDVAVERQNGHLEVHVRDTGVGISPKALGHIFERFYRVDESRQADTLHAGLGLAIVKGYLDILGGTVNVASAEGAGSTFSVRLPVR